jgi:hypothetical protein
MENTKTNRPDRSLRAECKSLSDRALWDLKLDREAIYSHPMESVDWVALLMTRYNKEAVDTIRSLPESDRFFHQVKVNRFKQINIWCVRGECSEGILDRLKTLPDTRVEPLTEGVSAGADR